MKSAPEGWPRISSSVFYDDAHAAIDWLCRVCGFEVRVKVEGEDGTIVHSELTFADGMVMVGHAGGRQERKIPLPARSPRSVGGANTQCLCIYLDDVDAHFARTKAAGARILDEPTTSDYGDEYWADRGYRIEDPEGHHWFFVQRVREQRRK